MNTLLLKNVTQEIKSQLDNMEKARIEAQRLDTSLRDVGLSVIADRLHDVYVVFIDSKYIIDDMIDNLTEKNLQ